ncbi:hypothetical protein D3C85_920480 [compost metagenome]
MLQLPLERVHLDQGVVVRALRRWRGDHDYKNVAAGRVTLGEEGSVQVVARIGSQLRRTGIQVADLDLRAQEECEDGQHPGHRESSQGGSSLREHAKKYPRAVSSSASGWLLRLRPQAVRCGTGTDANVRQQHRQQHKVGQDQERDACTGSHRQILDHRDVNHQQDCEAKHISDQGGEARKKQTPKGVTCSNQAMGPSADVLHDAVHLLRAMTHANGEHQKRHKYRVRIELQPKKPQQPKEPQDRDQRAGHNQQCAAHAPRVDIEDDSADQDRDAEERQDLPHPLEQVAAELSETSDVETYALRLVLRSQLFQHLRELSVVQGLAGAWILVQERDEHDRRAHVLGDQLTNLSRSRHIRSQFSDRFGRAIKVRRNHRPSLQPLLRNAEPTSRWRPQ